MYLGDQIVWSGCIAKGLPECINGFPEPPRFAKDDAELGPAFPTGVAARDFSRHFQAQDVIPFS
jgi:hypothetical protein